MKLTHTHTAHTYYIFVKRRRPNCTIASLCELSWAELLCISIHIIFIVAVVYARYGVHGMCIEKKANDFFPHRLSLFLGLNFAYVLKRRTYNMPTPQVVRFLYMNTNERKKNDENKNMSETMLRCMKLWRCQHMPLNVYRVGRSVGWCDCTIHYCTAPSSLLLL